MYLERFGMPTLKQFSDWWMKSIPLAFRIALSVIFLAFASGAVIWLLSGEKKLLVAALNASTLVFVALFIYGIYKFVASMNRAFVDEVRLVRQDRVSRREDRLRRIIREELRTIKSDF